MYTNGPTPPGGSSSLTKETPTKIPRISNGQAPTNSSPQSTLKSHASSLNTRRVSLNVSALTPANTVGGHTGGSIGGTTEPNTPVANEFGILDHQETPAQPVKAATMTPRRSSPQAPIARRTSVRTADQSPQLQTPAQPRQRQLSGLSAATTSKKPSARDQITLSGLRKSSAASSASIASFASAASENHARIAGLSPSKSMKPKVSLGGARGVDPYSSTGAGPSTPGSARHSLSTPSPVPSSVDEEEMLGDEEMMQYIRRQQQRKLASGARKEELDDLLRFPEPIPPAPALSPQCEPCPFPIKLVPAHSPV